MSENDERLRRSPVPMAGGSDDPSGLRNEMGDHFEKIRNKELTNPNVDRPENRPGAPR